ncbi:MAG: discoidin domain-containing protein [Candidatus Omnitrophota bacterium]
MRRIAGIFSVLFGFFVLILAGCSGSKISEGTAGTPAEKEMVQVQSLEVVNAGNEEDLVYLDVTGAEASSFDETPDWAPEPDPMAPVDGDMLTRWSSNYHEGEQWIYFDLGKERVISNAIIRWERAHARDYKIQGSNDAKNWQDLYHEKNGQGGNMEADFPPVKARYIRILGLERANEDWGISIWEAEIYGPRSANPGAEVTKEQYLNKGENEDDKEAAKTLISKLAAKAVPVSENSFQKVVVYTSWMAEELAMPVSDLTLAYLKELGVDSVAIMVPAYQEDLDSKEIFTNDKEGGDTPTMESLEHAIQTCHSLGMRVMLKPHVDPRTNEARINIMASEEWFNSYEEFILKYARLAQEQNVEIFSIGTELEATTFETWAGRWNQVIDKVKEVYKGYLTYSANWTEYKEVPFWDKIDFIGIDAYFPLTEDNEPTLDDLKSAWGARADEIEKWMEEKGLTAKGVVLTEIGYPSADGANRQPWVAVTNIEDQQEQADCLEATFDVLTKRPWFKGYYIWQFFPQDRWSPLGFTVKGKKSEEVLRNWLKK